MGKKTAKKKRKAAELKSIAPSLNGWTGAHYKKIRGPKANPRLIILDATLLRCHRGGRSRHGGGFRGGSARRDVAVSRARAGDLDLIVVDHALADSICGVVAVFPALVQAQLQV